MHLTFLFLGAASAATLHVDAGGGAAYSTVQAAIAAAASGDRIEVAPGDYSGAIDLQRKALTIVGTGGSAKTRLDGGGASWVVSHSLGAAGASLQGFTLTNDGGRGIYVAGTSLDLVDVVVEDTGLDTLPGGALYASSATVSLTDGRIAWASGNLGGAIYASATDLTLTDSLLEGNRAALGHGAAIHAVSGGSLAISGSTFDSNTIDQLDTYSGGAVFAQALSSVEISDSSFTGNQAYQGGALYLESTPATVRDAEFSDNWAYYGGAVTTVYVDWDEQGVQYSDNVGYYGSGALYLYQSPAVIRDAAFDDNLATYGNGGAITVSAYLDLSLTVGDSRFTDNVAYYAGGALELDGVYAGVTIADSTFDGNQGLYSGGGAIRSYYYTPLTVTDSSFTGNHTETDGGAINAYYEATTSLSGVQMVANTAGSTGGGLYQLGWGGYPLDIADSHLEANVADYEGGGIYASGVTLDLARSDLLANRTVELGFGGGLRLDALQPSALSDLRLEGNAATYGGGFYLTGSGAISGRNLVLLANSATHGGAGAVVDTDPLTLRFASIVANHADQSAAGLYQHDATVELDSAIVALQTGSAALHAAETPTPWASTARWSVFWDNAGGDASGAWGSQVIGDGVTAIDPGFARSPTASGANLVLARNSQALDLGNPDRSDRDGSRADPGAWGGALVDVVDADADGADSSVDCDDADAAIHPGAPETWYDGVDSDCLLGSDHDADGDGVDAQGHGGDDCDDSDPGVIDCEEEEEQPGDGGAQDDTGRPPLDRNEPAKGCSSAPASGGLLLGLLALLGSGRRRR